MDGSLEEETQLVFQILQVQLIVSLFGLTNQTMLVPEKLVVVKVSFSAGINLNLVELLVNLQFKLPFLG